MVQCLLVVFIFNRYGQFYRPQYYLTCYEFNLGFLK